MGLIDVRRKAPNVFTDESDIGKIVNKKLGEYPEFGGSYLKSSGKVWFDDIPDGPFNPNAEQCGFRDFYSSGETQSNPELGERYFNDDFLICGSEGDGENYTIRFCDFDAGYNNDFSICEGNNCRTRR